MSLFGPPNIDHLMDRRDVSGLIKALQYNDQKDKTAMIKVRVAACYALGRLQDQRAFDKLLDALQYSSYPEVNRAAAEALGWLGDLRAVEPLLREFTISKSRTMWSAAAAAVVSLINDPIQLAHYLHEKPYVLRAAAVKRLRELGHPAAIQALLAAIRESPPHFRQLIAQALDQAGWTPDHGPHGAWYWIAKQDWEHCRLLGSPAVEPLLHACFPAVADKAEQADLDLQELEWKLKDAGIGDENRYRSQWQAENNQVLSKIENLIVDLGDGIAVHWLEDLLSKPDLNPENELRIIRLLDQLGHFPATNKARFTYWLIEEDWAALSQAGADAIETLANYVFHDVPRSTYPGVVEAVRVLCSLGTPETIPVLIQLLDHKRKEIRILVAQTLINFYRTESLPTEIKTLIFNQRATITKAHSDNHKDFDYRIGEERCHMTEHASEHDDTGIGLVFPL